VKIGEGIVPRAKSRWHAVEGADAVVLYGLPSTAEQLREDGVPSWGSSRWAADLEDDRAAAHALCEDHGIACPEYHEFATADEAKAFAQEHQDQAWVFKAEGNVAATTTHVCKTPKELLQVLESEGQNPEVKKFILEAVVEGVEVSTEGWFDYRQPGGWLLPFNSTIERKTFGAENIGPNVGCMGSLVWTWAGSSPRLVRQVLLPITDVLRAERYVGPFDHNAIIAEDGTPYVLEPTPRLGWDAFEALGQMIPVGQLGEFLVALAQGRASSVPVAARFGAAVRLFMPIKSDAVRKVVPYPAVDIPDTPDVWLKDVFRDGETLRSTQTEPNLGFTIIGEATSAGDDAAACWQHIYDTVIPSLTVDGLFYRPDLAQETIEDLQELFAMGYRIAG
jgi:phosphoribosylamine-glycine ligase